MKTRTEITDISQYLPKDDDFAFAIQISDHPSIPNIGRIVILYDYSILHTQKRILLNAGLIHVDLTSGKNVTNVFNSEIRDWVVTNQFYVMLRDDDGNMLLNPEYIAPEDREDGIPLTMLQTQKYQLAPAFTYFSTAFKYLNGSNQAFFGSIILIGDEINNLFDVYGSLTTKLMEMPPEVDLNPEILKLASKAGSNTGKTKK